MRAILSRNVWRRASIILGVVLATTPFAQPLAAAQEPETTSLRFSPGDTGPVAYDTASRAYREGASFDPLYCAEEPCIELLHNIFDPLVRVDATGRLEPWLAVDWDRVDARTYRFQLRENVTFHNGEPFDARSVKFSLERASRAYGGTAWFTPIESVDVRSQTEVVVRLREPDSVLLHRLPNIGLMLPPDYIAEVGERGFAANPVGTGAFKFRRWDAETREVFLDANPDYWRRGYPKVDEVVYAYMTPDEAFERLGRGEIDLARRINPRRAKSFLETGTGRVVKAWLPQIVIGAFNLLRPQTPLRDIRVRQAINFSVNRAHLVRYGALGNGRVLASYTLPDDPLRAPDVEPYPYDPVQARRLLTEALGERTLSLTMMVDYQVPPQIENILSVSLRAIGVELDTKRVTESEFLAEVYLPKFGDRRPPRYDILLLSMPLGTIRHAANVPMTLLYSKKPNESALNDIVLDQLYESALRSEGRGERAWSRLERYIHDKHYLFLGYQEKAVFGANKDLHFTPRTLMSLWDASFQP
ncbi:MAG: ABC transporter substrate-binding protein [Alphaproteobacteria bacterium]|nr:ABC transporter substrate-binding protein [Alphaproteobacteria bacterium]